MNKFITIVSGLPRSGTSMMMKMLEYGGMPIVTDSLREADIDNPLGYYEFEKVKKIKEDATWLKDTRGKVFKMISMLLFDLPYGETYNIIFMERELEEVLRSQKKMLERKNIESDTDDIIMANLFNAHLKKIHAWLETQENINVLSVNYNSLIVAPEAEINTIINFLGEPLDAEKMIQVINPTLYRNRVAKK
ncbi:MAG: sulfotransferase [Desulfobacteraceae bacterium]|nr:sulfotransferase domain-containing protein [Desulfobacteraceae bacterium]MBC2753925.1 sulfotransferase [Desulfobacteraceae bacterium]